MSRLLRNTTKLLASLGLSAFLFVLLPSETWSAPGAAKLSGEIEVKIHAAGADDLLPVIIQTVGEPTSGHLARLHGRGGAVKSRHAAIRGYSARVPASQIAALAEDPEVEHVSFDSPVVAHLDVAYKAVKADLAWASSAGLDGRGVGIALVDTGAAGHRDLLRPKGSPQVVEVEVVGHENGLADYFGHGTHVAGVINGNGASSSDADSFRTFKGLAPGAQLISIRALHPDGTGFTSDIISAIDWAIRFRAVYNIRVLNLSLGHPVYESYKVDPMCRAVRKAYESGIVVVVAAGNDGGVGSGFGTITSPGNEPAAVTVGAMDDANTVTTADDVLAWYSSKGPSLLDDVVKPDLVAPGSSIVSLRAAGSYIDTAYPDLALTLGEYRNEPSGGTKPGDYLVLSGTSMAAPMVSATAALMLQQDPSLTAATVKARLMKSAVKDDRLIFETGAGYLDVDAALLASGHAQSALSPLAMPATDGNVYVEDTGIIWGIDFALGGIWGGGTKGACVGVNLLDVPDTITSAYGGVWGGKGGSASLLDNNMITASGLIWSGDRCSIASASGSLDVLGGIWGGGTKP
ncbi:MAG: S8 family serine peptidase [Acidobacteria bacterium]|nr:S8 family serine peptidase [Acidobacteriota bacterium]